MSRTLISRPNVEKLVRMADLDLRVKSNAEREEVIDNLMKSLQLGGNVSTNIYLITYRDANADQAKNVVQSLLTIFMESSLGDKRLDSRAAIKFLDDQIKHYEESLRAAESRLKEFKLKYMGVAGQAGPDFFGRLSKLGDDIESARLELRAAEESRDAYKRDLAGERSTRGSPLRKPSWTSSSGRSPTSTPMLWAPGASSINSRSNANRRLPLCKKRRRRPPSRPDRRRSAIRCSSK